MARFSSIRLIVSASLMSAAMLALSAMQVLASGNNGPFPK